MTIEILKSIVPFARFCLAVQYENYALTPEQIGALAQEKTPPHFSFRVTVEDEYFGTLSITNAGASEYGGLTPETAQRALEIAAENLLATRRESEGFYRGSELWDLNGELSLDQAASLTAQISEEIILRPVSATIECFPAQWHFEAEPNE